MRLLFVSNIFAPHVRGGYEIGCGQIAEHCQKLGHQVVVATSAVCGVLEKTSRNPRLRVEELFDPVYEYEKAIYDRTVSDPQCRSRAEAAFGGILPHNARALASFIEAYKPELIWIFNPLAIGTVGLLEACLTGDAPCVLHLMDAVDSVVEQHQTEQFLLPRYRRLKASLHAIACSEKMAVENTRLGEFASLRIIPNGVEFPALQPRERPPAAFAYFGQVERIKGVLQAVYGLRGLLDRNPASNATLDIIGPGSASFRRELDAEVNRLGLTAAVRIRGPLPHAEMLELLASFGVAVLPLKEQEPFGFTAVEAAARGLAVIVTAQIGASEYFPADYPLLLQNRESAAELAGHMAWCVAHPAVTRATAERLRATLRSRCDFQAAVMPSYLRAVQKLPAAPRRYRLGSMLGAHHAAALYRSSLSVS